MDVRDWAVGKVAHQERREGAGGGGAPARKVPPRQVQPTILKHASAS